MTSATEMPLTDVSPASGTKDAIRLAIAFSEAVKAEFTVVEFRTMNERNRALPADSGICHSHDYCDANMLMLDAFTEVLDREPWFLTDPDCPKGEADMRLWGDAWAIAKATSFFA
jgi:hypothetical protein